MDSEVFQSLTYADRELMAAATITKLVLGEHGAQCALVAGGALQG